MNTNANNNAEQINNQTNANNVDAIREAAAEHRRLADELEESVARINAENDKAEAGPSGIVSKTRKAARSKTVKKVLGYTLVVGTVALVGTYFIQRLRDVGVEVGDDVVDAIEGAAETVVEAVA